MFRAYSRRARKTLSLQEVFILRYGFLDFWRSHMRPGTRRRARGSRKRPSARQLYLYPVVRGTVSDHRSLPADLGAYTALLGAFAERGYEIRDFETVERERKHLVLRHDIDIALRPALRLAEAERDIGAKATYFVMLRSELYNACSETGLETLRGIADCGHSIGLHFDGALYGSAQDDLDAAAARECAALEAMLETKIRIISFHRPAKAVQGLDTRLAGRRHTYEPHFIEAIGYCSDSRGRWDHGHPFDNLAVVEGRALQLLTHPVWWNGNGSAAARLRVLLGNRFAVLDRDLAAQSGVHDAGSFRIEMR